MLKYLLDEHYNGLKPYLQALGAEVYTVQDSGLQGKEDVEVGKYASSNSLVLVTQDELPAQITEMLGGKSLQVRQSDIAMLVKALVEKKYPS